MPDESSTKLKGGENGRREATGNRCEERGIVEPTLGGNKERTAGAGARQRVGSRSDTGNKRKVHCK